jgi:hypothetical protein
MDLRYRILDSNSIDNYSFKSGHNNTIIFYNSNAIFFCEETWALPYSHYLICPPYYVDMLIVVNRIAI